MTEVTLHAGPRWRDVVAEQVRIVGLSLRREALVMAVALLIGTVVIVREIAGGGPGFDSNEEFPTALISFLFPFAVWRGEKRFAPSFLWTLPVDRRRLALAKVLAGGVWLAAALAIFVLWLSALGAIAGAPPARALTRIPVPATAAMYLFGSALVLGLRHPLRWLFGGAGVLFLVGAVSDLLVQPNDGEWKYVPGIGAYFSAVSRLMAAWIRLPDAAQWTISTVVWVGAGALALWIASLRHDERRRPRQRRRP